MTIYYRVRAHETDTRNNTAFEGSKHSLDMAVDHAERWAAQYYGSKETTGPRPMVRVGISSVACRRTAPMSRLPV